jgi:hypothetical protein
VHSPEALPRLTIDSDVLFDMAVDMRFDALDAIRGKGCEDSCGRIIQYPPALTPELSDSLAVAMGHPQPLLSVNQGFPNVMNRTGFLGGLIPREDGAHGTTQQVRPGVA